VIIKHNNPCGVAIGADALDAYRKAFACDPMSAFGGIVCLNRSVDAELAAALKEQFIEVLFARGYSGDALTALAEKQNMRILDDQDEHRGIAPGDPHMRQVAGGLLVQDRDSLTERRAEMSVVSERAPAESEWRDLEFAWVVCKHVKSNAIVICRDGATIGIGAGQMSRVDSVRVAIEKAQDGVAGSALASDAYFPFSDGPELALEAGVSSIVQPGGSVRDNLTIEAVDQAGAAMVFTGHRHFRH
jgi:phosphoribosylaminoimidazolecarboxamide formyltransferase/IMP cyclohydrolase